jgi:hypothetical protein
VIGSVRLDGEWIIFDGTNHTKSSLFQTQRQATTAGEQINGSRLLHQLDSQTDVQ